MTAEAPGESPYPDLARDRSQPPEVEFEGTYRYGVGTTRTFSFVQCNGINHGMHWVKRSEGVLCRGVHSPGWWNTERLADQDLVAEAVMLLDEHIEYGYTYCAYVDPMTGEVVGG